jgi:hypothetical protein
MGELLTIDEIYAKFPNEWVLIDKPETDQNLRITRGTVLFHSPDRDQVNAKAMDLPIPRHLAVRYTGKPQYGHVRIL